ncbi:hypothetical protein ACWV27_25480 (plasmid) [Massilia varians]
MSAFTYPILIKPDATSSILQPLPLTHGKEGLYSEEWLQKMLFSHPKALPIREIDPHAGDLVSICMELKTDDGYADILYMTRTGQVVLVETKLWRNSGARREVVAQILDYAKELSKWTYLELSRRVAIATGGGPQALLACMKAAHPDLDEAVFEDGVNRSLKSGDFLLIIAGDGIRYSAESLVGFIEQYGHLRFKLALVETATYQLPDQALLLQPRILAKTESLQRTVYITKDVSDANAALEAHSLPSEDEKLARNAAIAARFARFWAEYLTALKLDDQAQPVPDKPSKTTNLVLYLPPGSGRAWISAYVAQGVDQAGVFLTFSRSFAQGPAWYEALYNQREMIEADVPGLTWERNADGKVWIEAPPTQIGNLEDENNRARLVRYLTEQTNRMVNAFRHRLASLSQANPQN